MSNLSAFMRANVEQIENHKFAASPRIKGCLLYTSDAADD